MNKRPAFKAKVWNKHKCVFVYRKTFLSLKQDDDRDVFRNFQTVVHLKFVRRDVHRFLTGLMFITSSICFSLCAPLSCSVPVFESQGNQWHRL